jgi:hypothetical protein
MGAPTGETIAPAWQAAAEKAAAEAAAKEKAQASGGGGGGGGSGAAGLLSGLDLQKKQDKWMALALAGAQLAMSQQPSFGAAVGEAFSTGLNALQGYRDKWKQQELLAWKIKHAGAGGAGGLAGLGGIPKGMLDNYFSRANALTDDLRSIDATLSSGVMVGQDGIEVPLTDAMKAQLEAKARDISQELSMYNQSLPGRSWANRPVGDSANAGS